MTQGPCSACACAILGLALTTCAGARWQIDTSPVPLLTRGGFDDPRAIVCVQPTVPGKDSSSARTVIRPSSTQPPVHGCNPQNLSAPVTAPPADPLFWVKLGDDGAFATVEPEYYLCGERDLVFSHLARIASLVTAVVTAEQIESMSAAGVEGYLRHFDPSTWKESCSIEGLTFSVDSYQQLSGRTDVGAYHAGPSSRAGCSTVIFVLGRGADKVMYKETLEVCPFEAPWPNLGASPSSRAEGKQRATELEKRRVEVDAAAKKLDLAFKRLNSIPLSNCPDMAAAVSEYCDAAEGYCLLVGTPGVGAADAHARTVCELSRAQCSSLREEHGGCIGPSTLQ